jgi:hypothetical protein
MGLGAISKHSVQKSLSRKEMRWVLDNGRTFFKAVATQ